MYSPSRPPALSKNLPGELWQVGKTVTQGELEVINPGYIFTTISSIQPGEGKFADSAQPKLLRSHMSQLLCNDPSDVTHC